MKIATWNVNGIKARAETVAAWLRDEAPDVAVLQEIKSVDEAFPRYLVEDAGYELHTHGQKGFNGVALLSKTPLEDVTRGLPGLDGTPEDGDEQARYMEGTVIGKAGAVRICGLYLPNGNPAPGWKYDYKLAWMARLEARARVLLAEETPFLMTGDFNVIPEDMDVARPEVMAADALMLPDTRRAWRRIVNLGLTEAFRVRQPGPGHYSFWDYQAGAWDRNHGLRIDHFLLSPAVADRMTDCTIQTAMRGGERPSDHVPVWLTLDI